MDPIAGGRPKINGDHFASEILALFDDQFFPLILGIRRVWVLVCIPPSLYDIFYQIFFKLSQYFSTYKGVKILKYDKIQTFQIDYLSPFLTLGGTMVQTV